MTYYRVDFITESNGSLRSRKFRTEETAKKHAKRVLALRDDSELESKVAIVAVSKGRPSVA